MERSINDKTKHIGSNRRNFLKTVVATAGIASVAGCAGLSGDSASVGSSSNEETDGDLPDLEIEIGSILPPDSWEKDHAGAIEFKNYVERNSGGQAQVNIYPSGELGGTLELVEQTIDGTLDITFGQTQDHLTTYDPNMNIFAIPYAFDSLQVQDAVATGEVGAQIMQGFTEKTGLIPLGYQPISDFKAWSTSGQQITSIEDFDGLDIRTPGGDANNTLYSSLGANPQQVDWGELYSALDQGVVDGQTNPAVHQFTMSFHEAQDYLFVDKHQLSYAFELMNEDWYNNLHPTYQKMIMEGGLVWMMHSRRQNALVRDRIFDDLEETGMEITFAGEDVRDELREASQTEVIETIRDEADDPELVDAFLEDGESQRDRMTPDY